MVEINPGTESPVFVYFSNDAATKLELVSPSNPLPVSATITPSGTQNVQGTGTAGTPAGGVLSVQGVSGGQALPENITQVNGANISTGVGGSTDGTQRVALSTDSSVIVTQSTASNLNATIQGLGTAGSASGGIVTVQGSASGTAIPTSVTGNVTVVQPTGTNLHAVLDATSTTAVTQATASALNATIVGPGTSTTASGGSLSTNVDSVVDGTTSTASVTSATTVLTFANTQGYGYIVFGFTSVGSGNTIVVDGASDGTNYNQTPLLFYRVDGIYGNSATPLTTLTYAVPITAQAMRIRVSVYGSGTVTAYGTLKRGTIPAPSGLPQANNGLQVTGTVASGSADSGNPVKTGGKYNSTPIALTNGQRGDTQLTPTGATLVEEGGRTFAHISTSTTTTVKSGAGYLHSITINSLGTVASTLTLYDNTAGSGTVIAIINSLTISGTLTYDVSFATGLTIVSTGTVAPDVTVSYR